MPKTSKYWMSILHVISPWERLKERTWRSDLWGKGIGKSIYIAPLLKYLTLTALRHGSQFHLQITPYHSLPRKHSPDGASPDWGCRPFNCSLLLIYLPQKDERLSWPSWLTYSGWFTNISGHPSAGGRAQDRESSAVKHQCSTNAPCNQLEMRMDVCLQ